MNASSRTKTMKAYTIASDMRGQLRGEASGRSNNLKIHAVLLGSSDL
jgi:hypothetical protein